NVPVAEQLLDELDRWRLTSLQPDHRAHAPLRGERRHRSRVPEIAAERPLAVDGLASGKRGGDELSMLRDLHRDSDQLDVCLAHQLLVIRETRRDSEGLAG